MTTSRGPDSDGSLPVTLGTALAVMTLSLAFVAPATALGALGCPVAGSLLAGVRVRSRGRAGARLRPAF